MNVWNTGEPPAPNRVYICWHQGEPDGFYALAVWTGTTWIPFNDDNRGLTPTAWMFLPDGPGPGGQPRAVRA